MFRQILKFIFSKRDEGIYCYITILGIRITTKPLRLKIENRLNEIEKKINDLYPLVYEKSDDMSKHFDNLYHFMYDRMLDIHKRLDEIDGVICGKTGEMHKRFDEVGGLIWGRADDMHKRFDEVGGLIWERTGSLHGRFDETRKEILISRNYYLELLENNNTFNLENIKNIPFVSVIIPVYNIGKKYLIRCLDSVVNQTLKNIEIIIVNDCSPLEEDDIICKEYKNKDSRIKYIVHDVNKGLGEARITGLKEATGYSVSFIDSDDFTSNRLYEITFSEMIKNNVDIVAYNFFNVVENGDNISYYASYYYDIPYSIFYKKDLMKLFCNSPIVASGYTWTKLVKIEILLKLGFDIVKGRYMYEDMNYSFKIFNISDSVLYLPLGLYFYISNRGNSLMNGSNKLKDNYFSDLFDSFSDMYDFLNKESNAELTQLFLSNISWLYYEAIRQDNLKIKEENHFINVFSNDVIIKLIEYGALDKQTLLDKISTVTNDINMINWLKNILTKN